MSEQSLFAPAPARIQAELETLRRRRAELVRRLEELDDRIKRRERYIALGEELLQEDDVQEVAAPVPVSGAAAPPVVRPPAPPRVMLLLAQYPRDGYGAVTRAIETLLGSQKTGFSAKDLADILERLNFVVKDSHEAAVRSALKNLRKQGKVRHDSASGRYQKIDLVPAEAATG